MVSAAFFAPLRAWLRPSLLGFASVLLGFQPSWAAATRVPGAAAAAGLPPAAPLWQPSGRPVEGAPLWSTRPFANSPTPVWTSPNPAPVKASPIWLPR